MKSNTTTTANTNEIIVDNIATIYCITNILNGMKYIGCTTSDLKDRIAKHKHNANNVNYNRCISNAIREHGFDNFKFDVIEYCDANEMLEREAFYIAEFDTTDSEKGYNKNQFGEGFQSGELHAKYDSKIYVFENTETNEVVEMNKDKFIEKYGLNYYNVNKLINNKLSIYRKWILKK